MARVISTTSSKSILNKVASTFNLGDSNWHGDAVEYIGEAIRGIGYHTGFEEKDINLVVRNYKVKIPCGVEDLSEVWKGCCPLLLGDSDSTICKGEWMAPNQQKIYELNDAFERYLDLQKLLDEMATDPGLEPYEVTPQDVTDAANAVYNIGRNLKLRGRVNDYVGHWYKIDSGYIQTSFPVGEITIKKAAVGMVDDEGYPLVVNTFKYTEAVMWYVIYKMLLGAYDHPKLTWQHAFSMWEDHPGYRYQAANEAKQLGIAELERFSSRWLSIYRTSERTIY